MSALAELVDHFGIELDPFYQEAILPMVPDVLATGMHQAEAEGACDFTDMVWFRICGNCSRRNKILCL